MEPVKIIDFRTRNAFSYLQDDAGNFGWKIYPSNLPARIFEELRGANNQDVCTVAVREHGENQRILHLFMDGTQPNLENTERALDLKEYVFAHFPSQLAPTEIAIASNHDRYHAIYIAGTGDRIIGVGYDEQAKSTKGLMMAALLLYAFAGINVGKDYELAKNAYSYLPFQQEIGLDFDFYKFVDQLIEEVATNAPKNKIS